MPKNSKLEKEESVAMRPCVHGSTYCFCKHNLVAAITIQGHPKYQPSNGAHKRGKKGKMRKSGKSVKIQTLMG